jgi:hypothetical protein
MNVDAAGGSHEANDALNKLSSSANAPVFSYDSSFFGKLPAAFVACNLLHLNRRL